MKFVMPAIVATIASVGLIGALAETASASCVKGQIAWTSINRCSAPNQNRGSAQGTGVLGTSNRTLTVQCAVSGGTFAIAHGVDQLGNPMANCNPKANAGQTVSSLPNQCSGGNTHTLGIAF